MIPRAGSLKKVFPTFMASSRVCDSGGHKASFMYTVLSERPLPPQPFTVSPCGGLWGCPLGPGVEIDGRVCLPS